MAEATLRTTIYNVVNGVTNVGTVHDYVRYASDTSDFLDLFKTTISGSDVIRGWTVTCESFPQEIIQFDRGLLRHYTYKIRGYFGLDDSAASEKTAIAIVEDVVEALDANDTLHDGGTYHDASAASCDEFGHRVFGLVLVHYAEITQEVWEFREANV